jgi:hypothetical protein
LPQLKISLLNPYICLQYGNQESNRHSFLKMSTLRCLQQSIPNALWERRLANEECWSSLRPIDFICPASPHRASMTISALRHTQNCGRVKIR